MSQDDVTQIKVDKQSVGIMDLKRAMEQMVEEYAERPDDIVGTELLKRLSKKNYIPGRVKENYAKAFLREFKKFLGKPYEEEVSGGVEIKAVFPFSPKCS